MKTLTFTAHAYKKRTIQMSLKKKKRNQKKKQKQQKKSNTYLYCPRLKKRTVQTSLQKKKKKKKLEKKTTKENQKKLTFTVRALDFSLALSSNGVFQYGINVLLLLFFAFCRFFFSDTFLLQILLSKTKHKYRWNLLSLLRFGYQRGELS